MYGKIQRFWATAVRGCGEYVAVLNAYYSLQWFEKLSLGKTVAHLEPPGHLFAQADVVYVAASAYFQRPVSKPAAWPADCGEFVLDGGIYFFPETGH